MPCAYSFADWCSIAGLPIGIIALSYAVYQQRRADRETFRRKNLASEAHRFLVALKPSQSDQRTIEAIDDQLDRLKQSL
jgi:hypothetical protein